MITQLHHAPGDEAPTLHLQIPPDPRYARTVRDAVAGFASLHHVHRDDLDSLTFAIGEALANAIEHGGTDRDIEVECRIDRSEVVARVTDSGRGIDRVPVGLASLPDSFEERGRGIAIMQRCTDRFAIDSLPGAGTAITLALRRRDKVS